MDTQAFIGKNGTREMEIGNLVDSYVSEYLNGLNSTKYSLKAEANLFPVL